MDVTRRAAAERAERGETASYDKTLIRKDGTRWWGLFAPTRLSGSGRESECVEFVIDITPAKRAEAALRASEEKYRTLFTAMDEGYFLAEAIFDAAGRCLDLLDLDENPSAVRMMGRSFAGRRLSEINPGYQSYWCEILGRVARTGRGVRLERYDSPDRKWYDFYAFKVGGGDGRRVAVVFQDVTARKQAEEALPADLAGMRRLYDLHAKIANETDLIAALDEVLTVAAEFAHTDRGCVQLLSEDGERMEMVAHRGFGRGGAFTEYFRDTGSKPGCQMARTQRRRLIIEDLETFEPLLGTVDREVALSDGIRATQSTPMMTSKGAGARGLGPRSVTPPRRCSAAPPTCCSPPRTGRPGCPRRRPWRPVGKGGRRTSGGTSARTGPGSMHPACSPRTAPGGPWGT